MVCWMIVATLFGLFCGGLQAGTPVQTAFFASTQREMVYQELPCDCNCHRHVYDYRVCAVCLHSGGKFAQRIVQKNDKKNDSENESAQIEDEFKEGERG